MVAIVTGADICASRAAPSGGWNVHIIRQTVVRLARRQKCTMRTIRRQGREGKLAGRGTTGKEKEGDEEDDCIFFEVFTDPRTSPMRVARLMAAWRVRPGYTTPSRCLLPRQSSWFALCLLKLSMASLPDSPSWSTNQRNYAQLVRTNPQEAFTQFCSMCSSTPAVSLRRDVLAQLEVIEHFLDYANERSGYQSILHLIGPAFWEACIATNLVFVLVDLVAGADFLVPSVNSPNYLISPWDDTDYTLGLDSTSRKSSQGS
ncbi:hypothetical protein PENSPDRAFT_489645 [Peniophora sp. CONT]|nr:hypothetical protein PENSPDRAFT_489645 [Peniophora sp. CONT]